MSYNALSTSQSNSNGMHTTGKTLYNPVSAEMSPNVVDHTESSEEAPVCVDDSKSPGKSSCFVHDELTPVHNLNYYVLLIFHTDVDMRPCNPVLQVINLPTSRDTLQHQLLLNPHGISMVKACQLCDQCINSAYEFEIEKHKILSIYALSITDTEARAFINKVSLVNTCVSSNQMILTQRSNIGFVPRIFHRAVQMGVRSVMQVQTAQTLTDVQLCIILLRESLDSARAVSVNLRALHPYLATPENLQDALTIYTRSLDKEAFKSGKFKFSFI